MVRKQTVLNQYGAAIRKCCASCTHKKYTSNEDFRDCEFGEKRIPPTYVCPRWQMNVMYEKVGKGDGRIKKGSYLRFVLKAIMDDHMKLFDAREEYQRQFGDIYQF